MMYKVVWKIDIDATDPADAAQQALDIVQEPGSSACVFDVTDSVGNIIQIDLFHMKISKTPTKWIIAKASCRNEYTECNSCLIELQEGTIDIWKERAGRVKRMGADTKDLVGAEWLFIWVDYLKLDAESECGLKDGWSYVTLTKKEQEKIEKEWAIEERVTAETIHINQNGQAWFQAYGRYSNDEYHTVEVDIDKL